jgi:hypothetical protein
MQQTEWASQKAEISVMSSKFNDSQKANWPVMLTAVSVVVVIMGAVGSAYVSPIKGDLAHMEKSVEKIDRNDMTVRGLEKNFEREISAIIEKLKEIETQFSWATDVGNQRARNVDRMISILWGKSFGAELPAPLLPPAGPGQSGNGGKPSMR